MAEVTVLMPVYNGAPFLNSAVTSILNQTFTDIEFLIINDGSSDDTKQIIHNFSDARIRYIENKANLGLIETLNIGIKLSKGTYIARMDADDISISSRIEKQVLYMKNNPEIDILGTWFSTIDSDTMINHPLTDGECQVNLLQGTVLGHPTVLFKKKSVIRNGLLFHLDSKFAEDYRFWAEASLKGLRIANLPEVLLNYRIHDKQISSAFSEDQLVAVNQIRLWYGKNYFGGIIEKNEDLYLKLLNNDVGTIQLYKKAVTLTNELKKLNKITYSNNQVYLENLLDNLLNKIAERCYTHCIDCNAFNLLTSLYDKRFYTMTTNRGKLKFLLKSFIGKSF